MPPEPGGVVAPACEPPTGVTDGVNGSEPFAPPTVLASSSRPPALEQATSRPKQSATERRQRGERRSRVRVFTVTLEDKAGRWLSVFIIQTHVNLRGGELTSPPSKVFHCQLSVAQPRAGTVTARTLSLTPTDSD